MLILSLIPYMATLEDLFSSGAKEMWIVPGVICMLVGIGFWLITFFKFKPTNSTAKLLLIVWQIVFLLLTILPGIFLIVCIEVGSDSLYVTSWVLLIINLIASAILYGVAVYYTTKNINPTPVA